MSDHASFIIAAFAIAGGVLAVTVLWIILDHQRLKQALSRFPARDGDEA
jgi:heme exporter protein CcmD